MSADQQLELIGAILTLDIPPVNKLAKIRVLLRKPYGEAKLTEDKRAYMKSYLEDRVAKGICVRCGRPNDRAPRYATCSNHSPKRKQCN